MSDTTAPTATVVVGNPKRGSRTLDSAVATAEAIVGAAGWRFVFPALAAGPALGIMAIARLRTLRAR